MASAVLTKEIGYILWFNKKNQKKIKKKKLVVYTDFEKQTQYIQNGTHDEAWLFCSVACSHWARNSHFG